MPVNKYPTGTGRVLSFPGSLGGIRQYPAAVSTGGATQPSDIATLYVWWKADAITGLADGNPVASWPDSGPNSLAATGTGTAQPLYKSGILNGRPVVRFDGINDTLTTAASTSLPDTSMFLALKPASAPSTSQFLLSPSGGLELRFASGRMAFVRTGVANAGSPSSTAISTAAFSVLGATFSTSGTYAFYLNGSPDGSGAHSVTVLSGSATRSFVNPTLGADVAEVIVYSSVLSTADRAAVTAYLGTKYGITVV